MGGMMSGKIKEIVGICDQCIFGQSYTSDGKLTRVCDGEYPITEEEAHNRIVEAMKTGKCDDYEYGHERWLEMKESGLGPCSYFVNTPPEEKYKIDRSYSDKPVFACSSFSQCLHGSRDIGCYWKVTGCTSQMRLDNPDKPASNDLFDAMVAAGIDESKIQNLKAD